MKSQKGFTLVEGLLIVLVVSFIAFAGWYVWDKNNSDTQEAQDTAVQPQSESQTENEDTDPQEEIPRSASWVKATSGRSGFSALIPDGWQIDNVIDSDWMVAREVTDTVYKEGTKAAIVERQGYGTDGPSRLSILQFRDGENYIVIEGGEQNLGSFEAANATGTKYYKKYPVESTEGIGPIPGQETYIYEFKTAGKTTFVIYNRQTYNEYSKDMVGITEDEPDILGIVEEMVATLEIN